MNTLERLIFIGGVFHFGILLASASVPRVLRWRESLAGLDPLTRHLIWVHGVFIVLTIVGMGTISLALPRELAAGSPLALAVCGFIAIFWIARLAVQFTLFDARPYLHGLVLKAGYHGLTLVFAYFSAVYAWAAIHAFRSLYT